MTRVHARDQVVGPAPGRVVANQDARILAALIDGDDADDLQELARHCGRTPLDID